MPLVAECISRMERVSGLKISIPVVWPWMVRVNCRKRRPATKGFIEVAFGSKCSLKQTSADIHLSRR